MLLAAVEFMILLDTAIVNIATPAIQARLHLSEADLPWIQNAYLLVFGGFLLLGGTNEHGTARRQRYRHLRASRDTCGEGWRIRRPNRCRDAFRRLPAGVPGRGGVGSALALAIIRQPKLATADTRKFSFHH